jgi:hypothetical protein
MDSALPGNASEEVGIADFLPNLNSTIDFDSKFLICVFTLFNLNKNLAAKNSCLKSVKF